MLVGGTKNRYVQYTTIYLKLHNLLEFRLLVSSFYVLFFRLGRKRSCLGPIPDFLPYGVFFGPPGISLTEHFFLYNRFSLAVIVCGFNCIFILSLTRLKYNVLNVFCVCMCVVFNKSLFYIIYSDLHEPQSTLNRNQQ